MRFPLAFPIALLNLLLGACDGSPGTVTAVSPPTVEEAYLATQRLTESTMPPELLAMIRSSKAARQMDDKNRAGFSLLSCKPTRDPATHECLVKTLKPAQTVTLRYRKEAGGWAVALRK